MIGQRVNNYEIVSQIGEGGMGTVYLARHSHIDRTAAVKVLRAGMAGDTGLVTRFLNEAKAANAIRHPNIIDIIDVGLLSDGRTPYLMMEMLDGENLAVRIRRSGRLRIAEAVGIAQQIAAALVAAHAKAIVHRDLKPENIYLVPDPSAPGGDRVKVLDFGIAKLRGTFGDAVHTQTGALMGTPPYMSPEQCRGVSGEVDHRTDIYALGIMLYEMVCGQPPFVAEGFGEVLVMHLTMPPQSPRSRNQGVPAALERVILQALEKNPNERFASMEEFRAALGTAPARTVPPGHTEERVHVPETARATTTFSATAGVVEDDISVTPAPKSRKGLVMAGAAAILAVVAFAVLRGGGTPAGSGAAGPGATEPPPAAATAPAAIAPTPTPAPTAPMPTPPPPVVKTPDPPPAARTAEATPPAVAGSSPDAGVAAKKTGTRKTSAKSEAMGKW